MISESYLLGAQMFNTSISVLCTHKLTRVTWCGKLKPNLINVQISMELMERLNLFKDKLEPLK